MAISTQIFDETALNHHLRKACLGLMVEFASRHSYLPSNYILYPSEAPAQNKSSTAKNPVTAGGFADIYQAVLLYGQNSLVVAVKRPRKKLLKK